MKAHLSKLTLATCSLILFGLFLGCSNPIKQSKKVSPPDVRLRQQMVQVVHGPYEKEDVKRSLLNLARNILTIRRKNMLGRDPVVQGVAPERFCFWAANALRSHRNKEVQDLFDYFFDPRDVVPNSCTTKDFRQVQLRLNSMRAIAQVCRRNKFVKEINKRIRENEAISNQVRPLCPNQQKKE